MKWEGREQSTNVEDRRMMGGLNRTSAVGGAGLLILLVATLLGFDPGQVARLIGVGQGGGGQQQADPNWKPSPEEQKLADFTKTIFRDTEIVWSDLFTKMGKRYEYPTLVLFNGSVRSACGSADEAMGPFYCPGDAKVYIDLEFYTDMQRKLNAPGEFARAYVVAHEVGHHVQRLLGFSTDRSNDGDANRASVRLELQADFLAGVWAYYGQKRFNFLEPGDAETAIHAAKQIGDDRLQHEATGRVMPEKFTHGTSAQRTKWFMEGLKTGDLNKAKLLFSLPYGEL
jgi:uncharacterized protein